MKTSKKKTASLLQAAGSYVLKKDKLSYGPLRLWIETSSRCNLSCGLCPNKGLKQEARGDMEMGLFQKIIDESKGFLRDAYLFHRGEPLVNRDIFSMVSYAKKAGIITKLHTNATLLTQEASRRLVDSGLDHLSFSFDGYSKEVYEKNRKGASFEKTLQNIRDFLRIKKEMGSSTPHTVIQVMETGQDSALPDIRKQRKDFLKSLGKDMPDRIRLRRPHNWGGLIQEIGIPEKKARSACTFCWYSLTILFDGKVCLCPQDFEAKNVIGDAARDDIKKVFHSQEIREFRVKNRDGQIAYLMPCQHCDRIQRKTFMGVPLEYLGSFLWER